MAKDLGQLYVGIDCNNCGVHGEGVPTDGGRTRCGKCGQFGEEAEHYCAEHGTRYPANYDYCPLCRAEERVAQREAEMHQRRSDPRMHSSVDAKRY